MSSLDPAKLAAFGLAVLLGGGLITICPTTGAVKIFDDADGLPRGAMNALSEVMGCYEADIDGTEAVVRHLHDRANQAVPQLAALRQHIEVLSGIPEHAEGAMRLLEQLPSVVELVKGLERRVTLQNAESEIPRVHDEISSTIVPFFAALHTLIKSVDSDSGAHVKKYLFE